LPQLEGAVDALPRRNGDGGQELFAFGRLVKYPLLVSVTDDEVQSLASWRETSMPIAFGATLIIGFIVLVALFLIRRLSLQEGLARALQLATERYQHTVDSVMDAIVAVDASMKVVLFNTAAERMFGRPAAQVIGEPLDMLLPQRLRSVHRRHIDRFGASATAAVTMDQQFDAVGLRADGSEFPFESSVSRTVFDGAMQMTAVLRDVTAHRLAETELRKANQQLRNLSASLQLVREEERTRISRELHDELGQQLTGLKLHLSWVGSRLKEGRAAAIEMIDDMRPLLDTAIASVRRISTELRPPILDDLGFSDAVTWHADEVSRRSGLKIVLDLDRAVPVMDVERTTALFRIVQESLTNVLRHARATKVEIALRIESDELALSISDDGMGFDRDVGKSGIGLVSMRERATAIGARFDIVDATGKGTTIRVRMPLDDVFRSGDKT
jgi:PAS domain S-box-containing protein